jgi:hypothetical protein
LLGPVQRDDADLALVWALAADQNCFVVHAFPWMVSVSE